MKKEKKKSQIIQLVMFAMVLLVFSIQKVNAMPNSTNLYLNNTLMNSTTKLYTAGAMNMSISIRTASTSTADDNLYQYGYIALCSAFGSYENRYINTVSSNVVSDLAVINSTVGCTIPTTSAYLKTARVLYITFKIPYSRFNIPVSGGSIFFTGNIDMAWYQTGSNEYSLISYGFSDQPYNFNESVDPSVIQNDTIINQQQTIIDQNTQTNNKLDEINNADISDRDKELPDNSGYKDYESAEGELKDKVNQVDLSVLNLGIDDNSSSFIWESMTKFLQSHAAVFGMMISILTIGIIKLALGR